MGKKNIISGLFILLFILSAATPTGIVKYQVKTIVIDAGHGGKDPGCSGKSNKESKIALQIALELGRIIKENMQDVKVIYTRSSDVFIELHERAAIANRNGADLFVSIHCNAAASSAAYGTETFAMGLHKTEGNLEIAKRENSVITKESNYQSNYEGFDPNSAEDHIMISQFQNAHVYNSLSLASKIEGQFKNSLNRKSNGVKQAGFLVLWKTTMPSVLVETGFLTNLNDETYLSNKTNQVYMASGIYRAIKEFKSELEK